MCDRKKMDLVSQVKLIHKTLTINGLYFVFLIPEFLLFCCRRGLEFESLHAIPVVLITLRWPVA